MLVSVHRASETSPVELFRAKAAAEARLRTSRMAWTVVRPTAYLETWLDVVGRPLAEAGRARIFGSGTNPVNFVAVDDVAAIIERVVVDWPAAGQAITVAGPRNMTLNELAQEIEEVIGRPARIDHVPRLVLRLGSALLGPIRPPVADLLRAALLMDRSDMRVDTGNRLMWFPEVPVTGTDSVVARTFAGPGA